MMKKGTRYFLLGFIIVSIIFAINYFEPNRPSATNNEGSEISSNLDNVRVKQKATSFERAKEVSSPDNFINSEPFKISDYIGKKVIIIDFWTYSCINCQRTLPYLNAWNEKYAEDGLLIVGVHTPEFDFEKKLANVQKAVNQFEIKYPVVMDNDFSTWQDYKNRFWPRKYVIDIDGFIRYDHIGEGGYEETEKVIQNLLAERKEVLGEIGNIDQNLLDIKNRAIGSLFDLSPEIYFGAERNEYLKNGMKNLVGPQSLLAEPPFSKNKLYLEGMWNFSPEFAMLEDGGGKINFKFSASDVYLVAGSDKSIKIRINVDGLPADFSAGEDVLFDKDGPFVEVKDERLYHLIHLTNGISEHLLELKMNEPGLKAFTFTFG